MTAVLIAGSTGMLGTRIAHHLLAQPAVNVRLLVRPSARQDPDKAQTLADLENLGATVVLGDVSDPAALDQATLGADVVISALQGDRSVIVDGQIALAEAAVRSGVRRFFPSDFALNLFEAPEGAPMFDLRREADGAIDTMDLEVVHVINGAFMDMMLDPQTAGIVDLTTDSARLWGTGDEEFNLTTVDDTARFTALLATDPDNVAGVRTISGSQTSFNRIITETERLIGRRLTTEVLGSSADLRRITAASDNPWAVIMEWYFLSMITVSPSTGEDANRYPQLKLTTLDDFLSAAHQALNQTHQTS